MLLAGSTRPSMKLYRFFVSFVKYILYIIYLAKSEMLYILFIQEKGLRRDYKKKQKKKLCGFNYFYFAAQTAKNWIDLLAFTCCFPFFIIISTLRGEIDIILEVLVVCLISWLGMVIGPLWHYDIGLIVVFLLSSWEFMVNCIVFLQGFRTFVWGFAFIEIYW